MNLDAVIVFLTAVVSAASSCFTSSPQVTTALQLISGILAVIGHALHIDGK